ncbi:MAG TPA: hypothetical protein DCS09_04720 [Porphyromonadaceae bacterium]|nr:hypothetical protein [Porphyromonadaceae bacterium]
MSKTSRRKLSMFQSGKQDAEIGYGIRWARHPLLNAYMMGYRSVRGGKKPSWLKSLFGVK